MHPLFGLIVSILMCAAGWAQSTAQVSGTIRDQTGAVLPGAEVTMTQTETGLSRNAVTDETGSYLLTNLPVGPYRLEAGLPGFRTYVQTGIVLQVNSNPQINAVLEVGQITDQVEVQADAALVETRSTGIGQVRAPFVNNRIDPALFAVPAVNVTKILPTTNDPCGQIRFGRKTNSDENVHIGKASSHATSKTMPERSHVGLWRWEARPR